jgi:Fe-S cluster assembly protein DRE2 N-terminus
MLDRISLGFARLPRNHYKKALLALPNLEEAAGEFDADYAEFKAVLSTVLESLQVGGRVHIGRPSEDVMKEAILSGFLIETGNGEVAF